MLPVTKLKKLCVKNELELLELPNGHYQNLPTSDEDIEDIEVMMDWI